MTGFFAGLARRGAGIAPPPGAPMLGLRPRARFEPMAGLPEPHSGAVGEFAAAPPDDSAAPASPAQTGTIARSAPPPNASGPPVFSPTLPTPAAPPVAASATAEPSTETSSTVYPAPAAAGPEPATAAAEPPARSSLLPEQPAAAAPTPEPRPPAPSGDQAAPPASAPSDAERLPPAVPAPGLAPAPLPTPALAIAAAEVPAAIEAMPPQVTIAIERIDIAFAAPSPPPHRPAAPAISRTSGFAAYARARRGSPR